MAKRKNFKNRIQARRESALKRRERDLSLYQMWNPKPVEKIVRAEADISFLKAKLV